MTIERSNPDVGSFDPALMHASSISTVVKAGNLVFFSGIVAATGQGEAVSPGDMAGQIAFVLDTLKKLLATRNLDMTNLVSTTTYTRDMESLLQHAHLLADAWKDGHPTSTFIEVKGLASPEFLLELVAVAAVG